MVNSNKALVIIPCGKSKIWAKNQHVGPVKAKDAYISNYFKLCRLYAERFSNNWLIFSGKYGVISPNFQLKKNYNKRLKISDPFKIRVKKQLIRFMSKRFNKIISLCGQEYSSFLQDILKNWGLTVYTPLAGLKIGAKQNKLKECIMRNEPL
jgi:hypothetical protein